jgi:hypothetical protein
MNIHNRKSPGKISERNVAIIEEQKNSIEIWLQQIMYRPIAQMFLPRLKFLDLSYFWIYLCRPPLESGLVAGWKQSAIERWRNVIVLRPLGLAVTPDNNPTPPAELGQSHGWEEHTVIIMFTQAYLGYCASLDDPSNGLYPRIHCWACRE